MEVYSQRTQISRRKPSCPLQRNVVVEVLCVQKNGFTKVCVSMYPSVSPWSVLASKTLNLLC